MVGATTGTTPPSTIGTGTGSRTSPIASTARTRRWPLVIRCSPSSTAHRARKRWTRPPDSFRSSHRARGSWTRIRSSGRTSLPGPRAATSPRRALRSPPRAPGCSRWRGSRPWALAGCSHDHRPGCDARARGQRDPRARLLHHRAGRVRGAPRAKRLGEDEPAPLPPRLRPLHGAPDGGGPRRRARADHRACSRGLRAAAGGLRRRPRTRRARVRREAPPRRSGSDPRPPRAGRPRRSRARSGARALGPHAQAPGTRRRPHGLSAGPGLRRADRKPRSGRSGALPRPRREAPPRRPHAGARVAPARGGLRAHRPRTPSRPRAPRRSRDSDAARDRVPVTGRAPMRPRAIALVAVREAGQALGSRWFVLASGCFLVLSLGLSMLGLARAERSGSDRTTAGLLNLALLFVPLVTLTLGGLAIAGPLEDASMGALLAQPITRLEVYVGTYAGLLAAVATAVCTGFGATGLIVGARAGSGNVQAFLGLVGLMLLLGAATLALGTLLSVALRTRARVVGAAFSAWLLLVYVSDLGVIGLTIARNLRPAQVFVLALLNPVEQARVLGTLLLSDRLDLLGPVGAFGLDLFGASGLVALLVAMLAATVAATLAAGYALFRKVPVA